MSRASIPIEFDTEYDDPMEHVLENEEEIERVADRDDQLGAYARYMLGLARDEPVADEDADALGLPRLGGEP